MLVGCIISDSKTPRGRMTCQAAILPIVVDFDAQTVYRGFEKASWSNGFSSEGCVCPGESERSIRTGGL